MKDKVTATIDIDEIKEKLGCGEQQIWKQIPMVYAMVGWILTLGGGAFFCLSIILMAMSESWAMVISTPALILYSIVAIIAGAIFTGLSHIEEY